MKIAWVVPGGVDRSGHERVVPVLLWLIEKMAENHELHVFALRQYAHACTYPLLGAIVHNLGERRVPPGLGLVFEYSTLISELHAAGPFDMLHGFWAERSGLLAALAGRWLHIPVVVSLLGGELVALPEIGYGAQSNWRGRLRVKLACRWARRVTAASQYMCALAAGHGIEALEIPLGVHPAWFWEETTHRPGHPWRLLHVASLNRVKDQRTLLLAMKRVVTAEPQTKLDIIGEDTLGGEIQLLCKQLGLRDNITFHGFLPNEETRPFYQRAHLLVLSSRHDAAPIVMLEAAACCLPTVASKAVGYAADWHPDAALTVPPGDDEALAMAILALLSDPARREAMGYAAQCWARARDSDWTVQQFERLYAEIYRGV